MNTVPLIAGLLRSALRVTHIALWLTIPTTIWVWLLYAPPPQPRSCEPYCGWYQGNVLGVSEGAHLFIWSGLLLLGFTVFSCWIAGYCFDILKAALSGGRTLPAPHYGQLQQGRKLIFSSLRFWAPCIFAFICVGLLFEGIRSEFTLRATSHVLILFVAIVPVALLGNIVGIARYAACGERAMIYRRWENISLVLTNLPATMLFSLALVVLASLSTGALTLLSLLSQLKVSDLLADAALRSFAFFFILLSYHFLSSLLVAAYAKRIGLCDNLMPGATHSL